MLWSNLGTRLCGCPAETWDMSSSELCLDFSQMHRYEQKVELHALPWEFFAFPTPSLHVLSPVSRHVGAPP